MRKFLVLIQSKKNLAVSVSDAVSILPVLIIWWKCMFSVRLFPFFFSWYSSCTSFYSPWRKFKWIYLYQKKLKTRYRNHVVKYMRKKKKKLKVKQFRKEMMKTSFDWEKDKNLPCFFLFPKIKTFLLVKRGCFQSDFHCFSSSKVKKKFMLNIWLNVTECRKLGYQAKIFFSSTKDKVFGNFLVKPCNTVIRSPSFFFRLVIL